MTNNIDINSADNDIKNKAIEIYNEALRKHRDNSYSVLFSPSAQMTRFNHLIKSIDICEPGISILDVGCGNGALFDFLKARGFSGVYTGYDVNDNLLAKARLKFLKETANFENVDILLQKQQPKFDYILMSGLFNSDYGQSFDWICRFVHAMFGLSRRAVIFNAISTHVNRRDDSMYYIDPCALLDYIIRNVKPAATLLHDMPIFNFQIELRQDRR